MQNRLTLTRTLAAFALGTALLAPSFVYAEADKKPNLAGPKAESPTTQPSREKRGFSGDRKPGDRHRHMMELFADLGLSDDQKTKLREIGSEFRTKMEAWREANKEEHQKLMGEMKAAREAKDAEKTKAVAVKLDALRKTGPNPKDNFAKMREVLTEEQRAKFDERIKAHEEAMKARREKAMEGKKRPDGDKPARKANKPDEKKKTE